MRDKEFSLKYSELQDKLENFFLKRMKMSLSIDERAELAFDLVQETGLKALENSRKEIHADRSIEELLFFKAYNVWNDHVNRQQKFPNRDIRQKTGDPSTNEDNQQLMEINDTLEILHKMLDKKTWLVLESRAAGYTSLEIALELGINQDALRQMISRQIRRIKKKWERIDPV